MNPPARETIEVRRFACGPFATNCYLLGTDTADGSILIDAPPESFPTIRAELDRTGRALRLVLVTHGHWDHFADAHLFADALGAPVAAHALDAEEIATGSTSGIPLPVPVVGHRAERLLQAGDVVGIPGLELETLHVPGHTRGHVAFLHRPSGSLFSGDLLFAGSIGRTDLPGGSYDTIMESIASLLRAIPGGTIVHPGHGPPTTAEAERRTNPFVVEYFDIIDPEGMRAVD